MSSKFQFKHFTLKQDICAMKVGTDGVLLGAWSKNTDGNVLDIGCGSGLIGIMIAQRNENCIIDAIDKDKNAFLQSTENTAKCTWNNRIKVFHTSLQEFVPTKKYQLIISNPPFFVDATKSANESKNLARHADELPFQELIIGVSRLLANDGIFSIILPSTEEEMFCKLAQQHQLFLNRICYVKPNEARPIKRVIMEFSFQEISIKTETLTIETEKRHHYTKEYRNLTNDFYLNF